MMLGCLMDVVVRSVLLTEEKSSAASTHSAASAHSSASAHSAASTHSAASVHSLC